MKTVLIITMTLLLEIVSMAQIDSFSLQKEETYPSHQEARQMMLSTNFESIDLQINESDGGIPAGVLIGGGIGMVLLGAALPVNSSGAATGGALLIAGGFAIAGAGVTIAIRNGKDDKWE